MDDVDTVDDSNEGPQYKKSTEEIITVKSNDALSATGSSSSLTKATINESKTEISDESTKQVESVTNSKKSSQVALDASPSIFEPPLSVPSKEFLPENRVSMTNKEIRKSFLLNQTRSSGSSHSKHPPRLFDSKSLTYGVDGTAALTLTQVRDMSINVLSQNQNQKGSSEKIEIDESTADSESGTRIVDSTDSAAATSENEEQADASVLARPLGYRELDLFPTDKKNTNNVDVKRKAKTENENDSKNEQELGNDKSIQATPQNIEHTYALLRGVDLDPYNILWPTNGNFTILSAERMIEDYVRRCWRMCSRWAFHVGFLESHTSSYKNKYIYEVRWSLPTKENPISMACASVYFVFEVDTYGPRDDDVKVHYILEGSRYPHVPGEIPFQQKWISNIICEKIHTFGSVR